MNPPEQNTGIPLESSDSSPSLQHSQEKPDACVATSGLTIDDAVKRPKAIIVGIWIIMGVTTLSFFCSLILFLFDSSPPEQGITPIAIAFVVLCINARLCAAIYCDTNWARVVMLMLVLLNLLIASLDLLDPVIPEWPFLCLLFPSLLVVGSFCFFTPAANKWFRMWGE